MSGPEPDGPSAGAPSSGRSAFLVGAGIFLSRILGLVRQRAFAHYFGATAEGDAFSAAFRIPNFLQNLFGEGVLSASFIPVYAQLYARGEDEARRELAGAIFGILALVMSVVVMIGVVATPAFVQLVAPGFRGPTRELTIELVRILFPGAGLFVVAAWCLGILNSHGRFFLSYAAPVIWNVAMIVTLLVFGERETLPRLAVLLAWGSVIGAVLQLTIQWPAVSALLGAWRISLGRGSASARSVLTSFVPVFIGRGVNQISAYVDSAIASLLVVGSVTTLNYAQLLYMLPVSLFGISVTAAELPAMSRVTGEQHEIAARLRTRLDAGLRRIAFFIIPSAVGFMAFGDLVARLIYESGKFGPAEATWVWGVLAGSAVGLLSSTLGRLYASVLYALRDTRTPLRYALVRVGTTIVLGFALALWLPGALGIDPKWGVAGLTASSGVAAWIEFALLRHAVGARVGRVGAPIRLLATLWGCAALSAAAGWGVRTVVYGSGAPGFLGVVLVYAFVYGASTLAAGVPESRALAARIRRLG